MPGVGGVADAGVTGAPVDGSGEIGIVTGGAGDVDDAMGIGGIGDAGDGMGIGGIATGGAGSTLGACGCGLKTGGKGAGIPADACSRCVSAPTCSAMRRTSDSRTFTC